MAAHLRLPHALPQEGEPCHPARWPGPDKGRPGPQDAPALFKLTPRASSVSNNVDLKVAGTVGGALPGATDPPGKQRCEWATPAVGALNPPGSEEQGDSLVIRAEIVSPFSEAEKSENHVLIFES